MRISACMILGALSLGADLVHSEAGRPAGGERTTLLLLDDHHVLYRSGTERVFHPLRRHPANPILKPERPWEVLIGFNSVYRDAQTGKYQMWYQSWNGQVAQHRPQQCVVGYAESTDGVHFVRPDLQLFPFNNVEKTNIVLVGNGGYSCRYSNAVLVDAHEKEAGKRYKMGYFDWSPEDISKPLGPGLRVAFSPDGIHWTKHPGGPLLTVAYVNDWADPVPFNDQLDLPLHLRSALTMSDAVDLCHDPLREVYAYYGKMWIDGPDGGVAWKHALGRSESRDFIHWSRPELLLAPDDLDRPQAEFHTASVFFYGGVYLCLNQILDRATKGGVIDIELMLSRDGLRWERPFRDRRFLARSEGKEFDSGSIFANATPIVLDDEIRFYYGAYSLGAIDGSNDYAMASGIGMASMPRDRFSGIRSRARSDQAAYTKPLPENVGQITLKPIELRPYRQIMLNADAAQGSIRVELLDENALRVRGFSAQDAQPVTGDSLRHAVEWKGRALSDLPPGKYMLRLHLNQATIYAVSLQ